MYSRQLRKLEESVMRSLQKSDEYIRLEYISLKQKRVDSLRVGECIYLGESLPKLYITKDGKRYGELLIYSDNNTLRGTIAPITPSTEVEIAKDRGRVVIEPRVSIVKGVVEDYIELSIDIFRDIYLYIDDRVVARASLKIAKRGYVLKIEEMIDE